MSSKPNRYLCVDCRRDVREIGEYFIVQDEVWAQTGLSPNGGMLCVYDLERRIGRELDTPDFLMCPSNLLHVARWSDYMPVPGTYHYLRADYPEAKTSKLLRDRMYCGRNQLKAKAPRLRVSYATSSPTPST